MVESMIRTSYPAFNRGVEMARMPRAPSPRCLKKKRQKTRSFSRISRWYLSIVHLDELSGQSNGTNRLLVGCLQIVNILQNPRDPRVAALDLGPPRQNDILLTIA